MQGRLHVFPLTQYRAVIISLRDKRLYVFPIASCINSEFSQRTFGKIYPNSYYVLLISENIGERVKYLQQESFLYPDDRRIVIRRDQNSWHLEVLFSASRLRKNNKTFRLCRNRNFIFTLILVVKSFSKKLWKWKRNPKHKSKLFSFKTGNKMRTLLYYCD